MDVLIMIHSICAPYPEFADILNQHRAWIHKSPRPIKKPEHKEQNSEDEEDGQKSEHTPETMDRYRPEGSKRRGLKFGRRSEHPSPVSSGFLDVDFKPK